MLPTWSEGEIARRINGGLGAEERGISRRHRELEVGGHSGAEPTADVLGPASDAVFALAAEDGHVTTGLESDVLRGAEDAEPDLLGRGGVLGARQVAPPLSRA